MSLVKSEVIDS